MRLAEPVNIHLQPGREHQQQLTQFGEEVGDRSVLAVQVEAMWTQQDAEAQQPDQPGHPDPASQGGDADDDGHDDREFDQARESQEV